ncbi:MAG: DEAD/DEAH box helicase [Sulfolobus sp.]|nr:DEAD/DEAH box helicase [Sulfolobus sp.]
MTLEDIIKKILQNKKDVKINEEKLRNQAQIAEQIWREIEKNDSGKLFVFRAPPGYGKTEVFSSLIIKNFLQDEWYFPKAYIVEPTHALLTQMKDRLEKSISTFQLNDIFVSEDHGELVYPSYLYSGTVMVTTVDAYVYGYVAKRVKNGGGESGRFSMPVGLEVNSLTVFDEIHLIQDEAYLGPNVMSKIICPLVKAGGYVLLNSATIT